MMVARIKSQLHMVKVAVEAQVKQVEVLADHLAATAVLVCNLQFPEHRLTTPAAVAAAVGLVALLQAQVVMAAVVLEVHQMG
jgi:hypothetical protein